ncbi:hypothetical protein [uncultured Winogradskyella sp.]|uniref:hypothetical protein n=1 Tax=uncultured Winogradskyella sp. TaxID=395353 RepID=UPI0030D87FC5|tara:strand:- start:49472 stop:50017 length:546 start_codon:yes stop_codon:yes gene_type:complete
MENKYGNWREWILERFGNTELFKIEVDKDDIKYEVRSANPKNNVKITFHFMRPDDDETLYDIHFGGIDETKNNIWLSHFTTDPEFKPKSRRMETSLFMTKEFIDRLKNEWLNIPLKMGWTEEIYYVGKKIYRAKLRKGLNKGNEWDKNEKVPFDLKDFDYLKILLRIGTRSEQFTFEPMEK